MDSYRFVVECFLAFATPLCFLASGNRYGFSITSTNLHLALQYAVTASVRKLDFIRAKPDRLASAGALLPLALHLPVCRCRRGALSQA